MIDRDSREYELLQEAAAQVVAKQVPGFTCEIGVRTGGGSQIVIDELARSPLPYWHIGIDPWGNLPFSIGEPTTATVGGYGDEMMRQCLADLYGYANTQKVNLLLFVMTDTDFFEHFTNGVPIYCFGNRFVVNEYALVHYDGQHTTDAVLSAVAFFGPRSPLGAYWVFDDIQWLDTTQIDARCRSLGFMPVKRGRRKMVYRRDFDS